MDCARNERLLALHAGGDLPAGQERALSAHLQSCDACRRLASDFAAGRELLATHEPPEFDSAFFDRIRQNVLREIDDAPPPPAFARLTAFLFGRPAFALAACVAILIAIGVTGLRLRQGRSGSGDAPQQVADSRGDARQEPGAAPGIDSPGIRVAEVESKPAETIVASSPIAASSPQRRQLVANFRRMTRATRDARVAEPATPAFVEATGNDDAHTANAASPGEEAAPVTEVAELEAPAERKMLRIELQTGDPNVRIIWLTPQEPEKHPR